MRAGCLTLLICGVLIYSAALAQINLHNTYQGIPIEEKILPRMLPEPPAYMHEWRLENIELLSGIASIDTNGCEDAAYRTTLRKQQFASVQQLGHKKMGQSENYVLFMEHAANKFIVKIGSLAGRLKIKNADKKTGVSYIAAGSAANYLVLKECIEQKRLKFVAVPWTSLMYVKNEGTSIDDNNCFCVQEWVEGQRITARNVPLHVLKEFLVLCEAGYWDWSDGNVLYSNDGKYYLIDLSLPASASTNYFFRKNKWEYLSQVSAGFTYFLFSQTDPERLRFILKYISHSEVAMHILSLKQKDIPVHGFADRLGAISFFQSLVKQVTEKYRK